MSIEQSMTIDKAIAGSQIEKMAKVMGYANLVKALSGYIKIASEFFNRNQNMTEVQAIQTAGIIISEFPMLTVEDLVMAIKEAKSSKYGYEKVYSGVDGTVICQWLNYYFDRKMDRVEAQYKEQKKQWHNEMYEPRIGGTNRFEELLKKIVK